jgi:hypothetical protein
VELGRKENRTSKQVQIFRRMRKANKVVGCGWGIGEKKWGGNFRRRMMMFKSMVESILMHGERAGNGRNKKR